MSHPWLVLALFAGSCAAPSAAGTRPPTHQGAAMTPAPAAAVATAAPMGKACSCQMCSMKAQTLGGAAHDHGGKEKDAPAAPTPGAHDHNHGAAGQ